MREIFCLIVVGIVCSGIFQDGSAVFAGRHSGEVFKSRSHRREQLDVPFLNYRKARKEGLKYCGSEKLPPLRDEVCKKVCDGGQCKLFYCECETEADIPETCTRAVEATKCSDICKKSNFSSAYHCPKESSTTNHYCFCA